MKFLKYFKWSIAVSLAGFMAAALVGWYGEGTAQAVFRALFITLVLSVLEVSLSFDNAVVNATVLQKMNAVWRRRFLTWGIAIAVFGMRLVLPLVVVCAVASIGPFDALHLALMRPDEYGKVLESAKPVISAFGGAFLAMVCLKYFFDAEKNVHWINVLEDKLTILGRLEAIEAALVMILVYLVSRHVPEKDAARFLIAGNLGLVTFILVDGLAVFLEIEEKRMNDLGRAGAGLFLYLEVLDASFSFDGVIGAFAMTHDLVIIAIGLGIGAMFVRSLTILLVDEKTLATFRFLEHGAFYAIGCLSLIMFLKVIHEVPEVVTGLIGAVFIGLSLYSSIRYRNKALRGGKA